MSGSTPESTPTPIDPEPTPGRDEVHYRAGFAEAVTPPPTADTMPHAASGAEAEAVTPPPTADTMPHAASGAEPEYAEPVDPWATGEAAAFASAGVHPPAGSATSGAGPGHHATPWLASADGGRPVRSYRKVLWLGAAAVVIVLGLATTLAVIFWPGDRALDYRAFASSPPTRLAPAVPVSSGFSDSAVIGDRIYFATAGEDGTLGVVAADADSGERLWASTAAGVAPRWDSMVALPQGLVVFTDTDSATRKRRMVVLGAGRGELLWERLIGDDDGVLFVADVAVLVDRVEKRLLFLELGGKGRVRAEQRSPTDDYGTATTVVAATTPADLRGPAGALGVAAAPDRDDDRRIVQIGADRSARVLDAGTGRVVVPARQSVADPDDDVIAHNGRLIVRESADTHRIMAYDLDELGEPRTLYTAPADVRLSELTPCGDDRVCWVETTGYDAKTTRVAGVNAAEGGGRWARAVPEADGLVPVGESVLVRQNGSPAAVTLLNPDGTVAWAHRGVAARLDGGNVLLFAKPLTTSPDDPSVAGRHLGGEVQEMGVLAGVRSQTCSWNTSVIACVADDDLVVQRFTG